MCEKPISSFLSFAEFRNEDTIWIVYVNFKYEECRQIGNMVYVDTRYNLYSTLNNA